MFNYEEYLNYKQGLDLDNSENDPQIINIPVGQKKSLLYKKNSIVQNHPTLPKPNEQEALWSTRTI